MTMPPPGGHEPPPSGYPPPSAFPPPTPSGYPPPPAGGYEQHGYGYAAGRPGLHANYAGFWIRVLAFIIDSIVLGIPSVILFFALVDVDLAGDGETGGLDIGGNPGFDTGAAILVTVLTTILGALYYGLQEGSSAGATLGKRACRLKVVDEVTLRPGIGNGRAFARYGVGLLFELPGQFVGILGLLTLVDILPMLGSDKKQTLHDRFTRTCVVKA